MSLKKRQYLLVIRLTFGRRFSTSRLDLLKQGFIIFVANKQVLHLKVEIILR